MGHLEDVVSDYYSHLKNALYYSFESCISGVIFLIHGFYPDVFVSAGSEKISKLNKQIEEDIKKKK